MKKLSLFRKRCFYILFLLFPVAFGVFMAGEVTLGALSGENILTREYFKDIGFKNPVICAVAVIAVIVTMSVLTLKYGKKLFDRNRFIAPVLVLISALAPRMTLFAVLRTVMIPYSDGKYAWTGAMGTAPERLAVKILQNGWNNFTGLLRYLIANFNIQYTTFMFFLFVADALIAVAVYLIAKEIINDDRFAVISAFFYAFSPSMLTRQFYLSPDIISQLGVAVATLMLIKMMKEKNIVRILIYAVLAGCFAGAANSFKSVARVLIVAVFIVLAIRFIADRHTAGQAVALLMAFVVFSGLSLGINKVGLKCSSYVLGMECQDLNTWHFINVGLNPYGAGSVSHGEGHYYNHLIVAGVDPDEARDFLFEKLAKDWSEADITVGEFAYKKARTAWRDDIQNFSKQMFNSVDRENMNRTQQKLWNFMLNTTPACCQVWYTVTMLLAFIGIIHIFFSHLEDNGLFLVSLHTFGFALMLLISEVQARYKSNVIHLLGLLAAVGIWRLFTAVTAKQEKAPETTETTKEEVKI